jgi:hypothetical protein
MTNWIDPRYKDVVEAIRRAQDVRRTDPDGDQAPVRGFIVPSAG